MEINKRVIERQFRRSMDSYDDHAVVQQRVATRLLALLAGELTTPPSRILELGCGTGLLTRLVAGRFPGAVLHVNDIVPEMCRRTALRHGLPETSILPGDAEDIPLPGQYDLILSASTFQWFTRPTDTLRRFRDHLSDNGLLAFSTFGRDNLLEIRELTHRGLPYRDREEMHAMLAPLFDILEEKEEHHRLLFPTPLDALHHLKRTGVNASVPPVPWTRGRLALFADRYRALFGQQGGVPLTYHVQYYICKPKI